MKRSILGERLRRIFVREQKPDGTVVARKGWRTVRKGEKPFNDDAVRAALNENH